MKKAVPIDVFLRKLLYNKRFTIPLSVILSFAIWLVAMINRNPVREQVFTDVTANISIENTAASEMGLGIVSDVSRQKFTVTVSGPNYIVSSLKAEDFLLSASVTDINSAGTFSLKIEGTRNSGKSGYKFVSINPSVIDVTFDYIDTKEFTVVPKLIGVGAADGLVAETPVVSSAEQSSVTIKGPRGIIEKIASVGALAEVNKTLSTTQSYDAGLVLYDGDGNIIYRYYQDGKIVDGSDNAVESNNLVLSFASVKVTQPISKKAVVNVAVSFSNLPSGITADMLNYSVDHSTVTVIGTPDIIDSMTSASLSAIDFRNVSSTSSSFEVSATLPDGVKLLDNIDYFTVTVDTSDFKEVVLNVNDIRIQGLEQSLTAKKESSIRNVKICGPSAVVSKLKSRDFYAVLNLLDKSAGEHTVEADIKSDTYNNVWQVGSYSTTVIIK